MTPLELRSRSRQNLASANQLADVDPDNAAQLAGFAAELRLKARYCAIKKIPNFPNSITELRASGMGELKTHDLDQLLKLSNVHSIAQSPHINWSSISNWRVEHRYHPVGTVDKSQVSKQIAATTLLLETLDYYELIEALLSNRVDLETEWGFSFSVFVLEYNDGLPNLLISNPYFWRVIMWNFFPSLQESIAKNIDSDIWAHIQNIEPLLPTDPRSHAYASLQRSFGGIVEVRETYAWHYNIKSAVLLSGNVGDPTPRAKVSDCVFL